MMDDGAGSVAGSVIVTHGPGSGSGKPKHIRILRVQIRMRIQIRNTAARPILFVQYVLFWRTNFWFRHTYLTDKVREH